MSDERHPLPLRTEPMLLGHLAVTRDVPQHLDWYARIEEIRRVDAVDREKEPTKRALLMRARNWAQMRVAGKIGAASGLSIGAAWTAFLASLYATGHGFGWLAASSFLLPIPIAWRAGRRLWERASLGGMADRSRPPTRANRLLASIKSAGRGFIAGFGFGFTLVFLQALLTWFMTPADTFAQEILLDAWTAAVGGTVSGGLGTLLSPLVGSPPPEPAALLASNEE